jgi:TetR/AcrR family transcriptional repressor of nem operon
MKSNNDTRSQILDAAQDILQRQSISGVSFQDLADRIGIKKGSMYYHFKSKDDLSIAILERASEDMSQALQRGLHKSASQQFWYFIDIFKSLMGQSERICPGGAFAGEWDKLNEPVQQQVNKLINLQIKGMKHIVEQGLESGEMTNHGQDSDALAHWIVSSIQGALLTSRVTGNQASFESSMNALGNYLITQ